MRESITSLDFNFTNAGGGHTASVTTVLGGKALDGGDGLGTVIGEMGELNNFSNPEIASAMARFVCTQLTTSAGPVKKTQMRRYSDRTSLLLESLIVLVRGVGCGPEGGEGERNIAYYSEVSNSPLQPFKSMGPKRPNNGSVIEIGRIYNQESAAAYNGIKMGLVYQNKELKRDLSLNLDFVSDSYERNPDLAQYELKYGYTLKDFKEMLGMVGVSVSGLPSNEGILFETSGTLSSVISSVASYLGYFWFIDPYSGGIIFVNTQTASALTVTDYTNTDDSNIVNASFTKSIATNKIINTYSGTTEKREGASQSRADMRSRKCFFKNVKLESFESFRKVITRVELAVFFAIFNQNQSTDVFDKFTYAITILAAQKVSDRPEDEKESILTDRFGDKLEGFDIRNLYPPEPYCTTQYSFLGDVKGDKFSIYVTANHETKRIAKLTKLRFFPNRIGNKYKYFLMNDKKSSGLQKMPKPSGSDLYAFLSAYFQIAGGIFVSNGYGEYKADRMQFTNTNNITISGPYEGKTFVHTIPELSAVSDVFDILKISPVTVKQMAEKTNGKAQTNNDFFFIALKTLAKLERPIIDRGGFIAEPVDFNPFIESTEYFEPSVARPQDLYMGGPAKSKERPLWANQGQVVLDIIAQSIKNYDAAVEWDKTLPLKYMRSKTVVNKKSEEGEEADDDEIANSSEGDQKKSDLFDRFDMRYWGLEQPPHNLLNKLSLSAASGTTIEMTTLRDIRGKYRDAPYSPSSSSRTIYGLNIPKFTPTLNSISLTVGSDGITTTINESTVKLIPPDQSFLMTMGMEALSPKSTTPKSFSAAQRNVFGL